MTFKFILDEILNKLLQLLQLGKSLNLFDSNGNQINTPEELKSHVEKQLND